jgi:superkiller protein 3
MLHRFAKTFPDSPLTDFIDDYCRWFKLPLPEPEDEPETDNGEEKPKEEKTDKKEKAQRWRRKKKGPNAKERRKARRQAGKEGVLAEDLDQEEKEELVSSMTVRLVLVGLCFRLTILEIARQAQTFVVCS